MKKYLTAIASVLDRKSIKKSFFGISFVLLIFIAIRPLLSSGFIPTHDGEYHLIRFHEFESMMFSGVVFPRWAPTLNSGYGVPLFNFFYPFPNYVGAMFHSLGATLSDSFKLSLFLAYGVAVFACYHWLGRLFNRRAALVGSVVFAYTPYWFVDMYIRGSIGEVMAISWLMIAFMSIEYNTNILTAIAIAGIIISHNILAMIFLPLLFMYILVRNKNIWIFFIGVGLASYFWVPAIVERVYVTGLNSVSYAEHFPELFQLLIPSWGTGFSVAGVNASEMSYQIGIVPLALLSLSFVIWIRKKNIVYKKLIILLFIISLVALYLMLSISLIVWKTIPVLNYIQFPWRLLSLYLPIAGFCGAYVVYRIKNTFFYLSIIVLMFLFSYSYTKPVAYESRSDAYYLSRSNFTDGTSSIGDSFSTIWSPWKVKRPEQKIEVLSGDAIAIVQHSSPAQYQVSVNSYRQSLLRFHVFYYPGWRIMIDQVSMPISHRDGTLIFSVPAGMHNVLIRFEDTPLRFGANMVSILCLLWLLRSSILRRIYAYRN